MDDIELSGTLTGTIGLVLMAIKKYGLEKTLQDLRTHCYVAKNSTSREIDEAYMSLLNILKACNPTFSKKRKGTQHISEIVEDVMDQLYDDYLNSQNEEEEDGD